MEKNEYDVKSASRTQVISALESFLEDNQNKVLALKGTWGIGKTYLVKDILERSCKEFYYSSVFGVASLSELKSQLLASYSSDSNKDTDEKPLSKVRTSIQKFSKHILTYSPLIEKLPRVGSFIPLTSDILFSSIKDTVVCIDDLERKSPKVGLDELLGFIEHIASERNCKVLLIFNEEHLQKDNESKEELDNYREKVIDTEIKFVPSVDDN